MPFLVPQMPQKSLYIPISLGFQYPFEQLLFPSILSSKKECNIRPNLSLDLRCSLAKSRLPLHHPNRGHTQPHFVVSLSMEIPTRADTICDRAFSGSPLSSYFPRYRQNAQSENSDTIHEKCPYLVQEHPHCAP